MQSICSVLPPEQWQQVIDARALACEDPLLGAIFDPPFAHFTHQLAQEYDWDGLTAALSKFAAAHQPFEARTTGVQIFSANDASPFVAVFRSPVLVQYHEALWEVVRPYAQGNVRDMDTPPTWIPHITIKRCGPNYENFGALMAKLAQRTFAWTFTIDNVSVQCDPGHDSRTHYQRLFYRLGEDSAGEPLNAPTNATITSLRQPEEGAAEPIWHFAVQPDSGETQTLSVSAPQLVRLMADARCSEVHFAGGRCRIEDGRVVAVLPKTPFPIVN